MTDSMEIFQLAGKENYSKVVLHKKLCVPLLPTPQDRPADGSPDMEAWRSRQEAERERIRQLDHTPMPPERPPKKLHLLRKMETEESSSKVARTIDLFTPRPFLLSSQDQGRGRPPLVKPVNNLILSNPVIQTDHRPQKRKPVVPPKPKFCSRTGTYLTKSENSHNSHNSHNSYNAHNTITDGDHVTKAEKLERKALDPNLTAELEEHLQQTDEVAGEEREEEKRRLGRQREELLIRIKDKVEMLRKDGSDVCDETEAVRAQGGRLVSLLEEQGSLVEGDKLRVHLQEVERLTSLLKVLTGRLSRTEKVLMRTGEAEQKDLLLKKKKRLQSQLTEAEELKQFRHRRGKQIQNILQNLLSQEEVEQYEDHLKNLEKVVAEQKEVEEKIQLGEEQIEALSRAES